MDEKREDHQRARRQNRWRRAAPFQWGVGAAEQRKREERSAADANPPPPRVIPQAPSRRSWKPSLDTQPVMAKRRTESVSARPPTGGSTLTLCSAGVAQPSFAPAAGLRGRAAEQVCRGDGRLWRTIRTADTGQADSFSREWSAARREKGRGPRRAAGHVGGACPCTALTYIPPLTSRISRGPLGARSIRVRQTDFLEKLLISLISSLSRLLNYRVPYQI